MLKMTVDKRPGNYYGYKKVAYRGRLERYMEIYVFQTPRFRSHVEITALRTGIKYEDAEFMIKELLLRLTYWSMILTTSYSRFTLPDSIILHKRLYKIN